VTPRPVYVDATALISLARIDRLDLLTLLPGPVRVTRWVWDEVVGDAAKPGVAALLQASEERMLLVVEEGDPDAYPQVDPGESTVLSAAAAVGAIVLIDERKARALIEADPVLRRSIAQVSGTVGLILLAKRRGLIPAVRPLLDDLIRQSFWIGPAFYEGALREAGELRWRGEGGAERGIRCDGYGSAPAAMRMNLAHLGGS
jgi:predicted nucleic acid-binding protein